MTLLFCIVRIRWCKLLTLFLKVHCPVLVYSMVSQSMILNIRTKVGLIRQNYNLIDGPINFSAEVKQFTYKMMQRNIIMSILR